MLLRIATVLAVASVLPACSSDTVVDAPIGADVPVADVPTLDDVPAIDDVPALDVPATPDVPSDSGSPVCPAVGGGYTLEGTTSGTCPAGGPNTYGFQLTLDAASCVLTLEGNDDPANILYLTGAGMIDEDGSLGPVGLMLNGTAVTCSATFSAGSPNRYAFDCDGCVFTIRYGE